MTKTKKTRLAIIEAMMALAAEKDWDDLTLQEIAGQAKAKLSELRGEFSSKQQILAAFIRHVDDEVLKKFDDVKAEETARERLFDVIMTRLEVMDPFKAGIKRLYEHTRFEPGLSACLLPNVMSSQYWMLNASGISAEGTSGLWRIPGLMSIYAAVFPVWLEDDDPGLAKTMAALDRRLSRAERWSNRIDNVAHDLAKLACIFVPGKRCRDRRRDEAKNTTKSTRNGSNGTAVEV